MLYSVHAVVGRAGVGRAARCSAAAWLGWQASASTAAPRMPRATVHGSVFVFRALNTASVDGGSAGSGAAGAALGVVLVKVGDGNYSSFKLAELGGMDRMDLLKALAKDEGFAVKLKGVALDDCSVSILKRVAGAVPSADEEAEAAATLVGARTLKEVTTDIALPPSAKCFIRVALPASTAAGVPSGAC